MNKATTRTQQEIVRRLENGGTIGPSDYGDSPVMLGGNRASEKFERRVRRDTLETMEDLGLIHERAYDSEWVLGPYVSAVAEQK